MSDAETRLWTREGFRRDEFTRVGPDHEGDLPENAILPLSRLEEALEGSNAELAVELAPGEAIDAILPHLGRIRLVALAFPAFTDGRSLSKAALLRDRHGYKGEIRAVGDVLIDQIPFMLRQGFDSFSVSNAATLQRLREDRLPSVDHYYQPAVRPAAEGPSYSWRRLPA